MAYIGSNRLFIGLIDLKRSEIIVVTRHAGEVALLMGQSIVSNEAPNLNRLHPLAGYDCHRVFGLSSSNRIIM